MRIARQCLPAAPLAALAAVSLEFPARLIRLLRTRLAAPVLHKAKHRSAHGSNALTARRKHQFIIISRVSFCQREPNPKISAAHRRGNYGLSSDCIARRRRGIALADFLGDARPIAQRSLTAI